MKKKALITGITGQTGSYLAEYLLELGYEVHGIIRRSSLIKTDRIDPIFKSLNLHYGDMTDGMNLMLIIDKVKPHEIYNLAAQSHVMVSFETPEYTANADGLGALRILEIIRQKHKKTKFFQASTSEMFGCTPPPQNERSVFQPQSPYAASKLYSYWLTKNYRDAYNLFAVNGIMFNHEGPRRGETFVTRKVTRYVAKYQLGLVSDPLTIGNLHAIRDWTDARDIVRGIYLSMQNKNPDDFVFGSGKGRTILELIELSFKKINVDLSWDNKLLQAKNKDNGKIIVKVDEKFKRPLEVNALIADYNKAKKQLGWKRDFSFNQMITEMIDNDIKELSQNNLRNILSSKINRSSDQKISFNYQKKLRKIS